MSTTTPGAAGAQIQGKRARQEDAYAVEPLGDGALLALVADGLGGHPGGDQASREGLAEFRRSFLALRAAGAETAREWLQQSVLAAHKHLLDQQRGNPELYSMATTLVAAYVVAPDGGPRQLWAATVGDSYLLLLRNEQLMLLNELHTEQGGITSSLGFNLTRVDLAAGLALEAGDRLLLASDGIAPLAGEDTGRILASADTPADAVQALLEAIEALAAPAQDNATAVAVFV